MAEGFVVRAGWGLEMEDFWAEGIFVDDDDDDVDE